MNDRAVVALGKIVQKGPDSLFVADFEIFRTALVKDATQGLSEFGEWYRRGLTTSVRSV
jgi:hypothetical protein